MRVIIRRALFLLLVVLSPAAGSFAWKHSPEARADSLFRDLARQVDSITLAPGIATLRNSRSETASLSPEMLQEYRRYAMKNVQSVFNWHLYSTIMIFFMVVIIVLTGLYLSYRQFRMQELAVKRGRDKLVATETAAESITTLELGKDGLKINSAVIGLIILTISLAFFFLYLKYVYPVQVLDQLP